MPKPRVFISHSARGDDRALALLTLLDQRLRQDGFEVLLDRKGLEVGDSWEYKIGTWLDRCHAAIVLVTTKALASHYVKFEVSNLLHRWQHQGGVAGTFPLLPVLVEPLTEPELTGFYSVVNLWSVQRLGPDTDAAIADALAGKLAILKQPNAAGGIDQRLAGNVGSILRKVDDDSLTEVAQSMGVDTSEWPAVNVAPLLADALISSRTADVWDAITRLQPRLHDAALFRNLFDLLMPCWVGPESARALEAVTVAAGPRCAVMSGKTTRFTPEMHLARAKAQRPALAGVVLPISVAGTGLNLQAELTVKVRQSLEAELDVNDSEVKTTVAAQLALRSSSQPVVVAVKLEMKQVPVLAGIAGTPEFRGATFLALTTDALPDNDPQGVTVLRPSLPGDLEDTSYLRHGQYEKTLSKL